MDCQVPEQVRETSVPSLHPMPSLATFSVFFQFPITNHLVLRASACANVELATASCVPWFWRAQSKQSWDVQLDSDGPDVCLSCFTVVFQRCLLLVNARPSVPGH